MQIIIVKMQYESNRNDEMLNVSEKVYQFHNIL